MENICKNCGDLISKKYCGNCGNTNTIARIDKQYAMQDLLSLMNFEKGFLYTTKQLLSNPGFVIREYINDNRKKITKPITYLILTSLIYTLISQLFETDQIYTDFSKKTYGDSSLSTINIWIQENMGYANILMIIPITIWTKIFFRKYHYNIYEVFVVISLVIGFAMLIFSIEPPIDYLIPSKIYLTSSLIALAALLYSSWAVGHFFGKGVKNFLKASLAYILGFLTSQFAIVIIAVIYDSFIK